MDSPASAEQAAVADSLTADIEDDGAVELALLATEHPNIKRFGHAALEHARIASALSKQCAPWLRDSSFPEAVLETYISVQAAIGAVQKDIEHLDSIDLSELEPGWGDKATIRMARKSLIGFADQVMKRLDQLQSRIAGAAAKMKVQRKDQGKQQAAPDDELSLEEKYRDKFRPPEQAMPGIKPAATGLFGHADASPTTAPAPPAKRLRMASVEEVEALLQKLQAKIGQQLQKRPLHVFRRQLLNFAAIPDLPKSPPLCRDSIECALSAVQAAVDEDPNCKLLGRMFFALQQIETLKDPSGLPPVLLDLADVVADV